MTPRLFFPAVFAMLFLGVFYFTVTNMAGIYIVSELGGSQRISVYPMVFYGLGNALTIPLSRSLIDRWGLSRLLVISLLLYTGCSILCALAPTFIWFNAFRLGLGMSAGPFFYFGRILIDTYALQEKKEQYVSLMILFYAIVPVLGSCFGAWLAYETHWRWIFHCNEPLAFVLALYFWRAFRSMDEPQTQKIPFDGVGYLLYCLGVAPLVIAAAMGQELDWVRSPLFRTLCLVGGVSFAGCILWECFHAHPIFELKLLRFPSLTYSLVNLGILFSSYFGMITLIALWLKIYANYTPLWISAILGTMAVSGTIVHFLCKRWIRTFDPRYPLALAIVFFIASCIYSAHFSVEVNFFRLAVARFLAGIGLVLFLAPLFRLAFASASSATVPSIFVLFQVVRTVSSSLGAALYTILWQRRQVFFHERLGEQLTLSSLQTEHYFRRATDLFHLTKDQATAQLNRLLDEQATSLGLNDTFGFMALLLGGLLVLLIASMSYGKLKLTLK